jgi:RimJ/RimL family protein N-acetyltransferase
VIRTHFCLTTDAAQLAQATAAPAAAASQVTATDWRSRLPVLCAGGVTLRELRLSDAASLQRLLTTPEVSRFISPPPTTVEGFERFIAWAQRERAAGRYVCFAVVPHGTDAAVGLFQIRQLDPGFETAEWGFALGQSHWGTGLFLTAAPAVVDFVIDTLGVNRLEARSSVLNVRGNGALRKLGAVPEALLRKSFLKDGEYQDQALWAITADDWRLLRMPVPGLVH